MRRILVTVHSSARGGAQRMALADAEHLSRFYDLLIAAPPGPLQASFAACGELVDPPPSLPLWSDAGLRLWSRRVAATAVHARRLSALIRRRGVSAVVTNSTVSMSPVLAARLTGVPVLVHARDPLESPLAPAARALHRALATTVIAISSPTRAPFEGGRARVVLIRDGIAVPPRPRPFNGRGSIRLGVIGTIERRKGQDVAVSALPSLVERGLDVTLELVGPAPDPAFEAEVRELAERLGVAGMVRWRGEVPSADAAFEGVDIALLPSRGEGLPLTAMEALVRELPVVASRVDGLPEAVRDGETGLLVEPGDPRALADAVATLATEPERARAMAARGRADIAGRFDLGDSVEALRREVERTLAAGRAPAGEPAR